ncbi:MAG TPA: prolyl oligopeptidase family serine peptidase [Bryobacteraceae bacterium]|nr:prolyl oligopeptidase family serine peptidase [Bryobacteraceae bacterium]
MRVRLSFSHALTALLFAAPMADLQAQPAKGVPPSAPVAPLKPVTDDYYGVKVVDPYRYFENINDPETRAWIKAQSDRAHAILADLHGRQRLLERIRQLDQTVPQIRPRPLPGNLYLISKRLPGEDIYKLYLRQGPTGSDKLLVDPEKIQLASENRGKGKNVIQYFEPSRDNRYVAVGVAPGGAERDTEMHVVEIATGRETGDVIFRAWGGSPAWLPGNRSLVYSKLQKLPPGAPATEIEQKVRAYLHVLGGGDSEKDPAVFGYQAVPSITVDPKQFAGIIASPASDYALGAINSGVDPNSAFYIQPITELGKANSAWRKVADFSDDVSDIAVHGNDLYILTFKNAKRYRVIRTDARAPDLASAETIVAPGSAVVSAIAAAQDALYVQLLDGAINRVLRVTYGPHPQTEELNLPVKGSAFVATDPRLPGALLVVISWRQAYKIYAYDPRTKEVRDTGLQPAGPYDAPANLESVEVSLTAPDGARVPLSITYPKTIKMDGSNPTLMEAYGAYGFPFPPNFEPMRLAWHEQGGVYAVCHVRGGGEYGEEWHLAGKQATKPNTWRDFIACAQYLIEHKYTSPAHLAGQGTSAGGILIGRAITERPDLFAAAIDQVGCSDMLRIETTANGLPNVPEFGSTKTKEGFQALYEMSAYHHIRPRTSYPAVLYETGFNDPRVDPWQMAKMAAAMQAATSSGKPVLLRVEYEGGHGAIGGTEKQQQERLADEWSFLLWQFGAAAFQPKQ